MIFSSVRFCAVLVLMLAGTLAGSAVRAEAGGAQSCAAMDDAAARLACYDRLHGRAALPRPVGPERSPQPESQEPEIVADVVEMGQTVTGRYWFRLSDGRRWEQLTRGRTGIAVGDEVRVTRRALGTYHLREAGGGSRSVQVRPTD